MKPYFAIPIYILLLLSCKSRPESDSFNLSFERTYKDSAIGWRAVNRNDSSFYTARLDSHIVRNGRYAASISYTGGKPHFTAWSYTLYHNYKGDSITLSGFIKTENVTDGFAGLWLRIDPMVAFNNMQDKELKGTTNWTKYAITLPLNPDKTEKIVFGGLLSGKGKMWMDDLNITIDGKDIRDLNPINNLPADKDHEFDKGSAISMGELNTDKINTLYEMGLIWGFLKYYHPSIIKGSYNWDFELFRILPKVLNVSKQEKEDVICKWIEGLGKFEEAPDRVLPDKIILQPDLEWITHSGFSAKLQSLLLKVKNAKRANDFQQYYVGETPAKNVEFRNEKSYFGLPVPDEGFRILALYRYWNMVQYFFPYKEMIDSDWKNTLKSFIPEMLHIRDQLEYRLAIVKLTAQIQDSHAFIDEDYFIGNYRGYRYLPVKLGFIEDRLVVSECPNEELAAKNGLQLGDIITKINNTPVQKKLQELIQYTPASNRSTQLRDIAHSLTRTGNDVQQIEFTRNGKKGNTATINTYTYDKLYTQKAFSVFEEPPYKWISDNIGYIDHGKLKKADLRGAFEKFQTAKGIIIDLRNYPSDFLVYDLPTYLLNKATPFAMISMPGVFSLQPALETGKPNKDHYRGKLILIVNETTQSSAEFHAMAYQTYPNSITIGSNTAGADGNVSEILLPGHVKTRFSGIGIYYPDSTPTQRIGIVPDIIIKPTIKGIINKKDELLERAISIISGSK